MGLVRATLFCMASLRPLSRAFYGRKPRQVARELLGKVLVRQEEHGSTLSARIVEVEAYLGERDPAAHASAGKTLRNAVIFGPPGHAYVYFIYGNHYCLNVSCEPEGLAGCVLFRALEPLTGIEEMARAPRPRTAWAEGLVEVDQRTGKAMRSLRNHAGSR